MATLQGGVNGQGGFLFNGRLIPFVIERLPTWIVAYAVEHRCGTLWQWLTRPHSRCRSRA